MVEIRAFRAIRYTKKAGELRNNITQPYDKITPAMQPGLYAKSEYNYCRLILPSEENRYEIASERLEKFLKDRIFEKDDKPGIYVYYHDFELFGKKRLRKGFICAVKLYPFDDKVVLPHEKTHAGPKIDRLNMLRATRKNLEPGFMLCPDPNNEIVKMLGEAAKGKPLMDVVDEYDVRNRVWRIDDPATIRKFQKVLEKEQVVIADGHHRYETAVSYRDERRAAEPKWTPDDSFNFRMTYMVPVEDEGLAILPGHRLLLKSELTEKHLSELKKYFTFEELSKKGVPKFLETNRTQICFVIYTGKDRYTGLVLKDVASVGKFFKPEYSEDYKHLDVVVLRDVLFEGIIGAKDLKIDVDIDYARWVDDAVAKVDSGKAKVAFILNATRPEQVLAVAKKGERMPEKSTDFYPKMMSGLTMMDIGVGEKLPK
jgi:uncharacterized protein (DUF1015 family)